MFGKREHIHVPLSGKNSVLAECVVCVDGQLTDGEWVCPELARVN